MSDSQTKPIYCAQQINVPPTFPHILKLYAKAAIRTQPNDLLRWTAAYFRALANGEVPPAKDRLEYPPFVHPSGITPGYLKTLLNRFGYVNKVRLRALLLDCQGLDLPETSLYQLFMVVGLLEDKEYCDFYRFLAVACGFLGNDLLETMIYVCELLTHEPEGGSAMIPLRIFLDLYGYLADLDCGGERRKAERVDSPCDTSTSVSKASSGTIDLTMRARSCDVDAQETTNDAFEFNYESEEGVAREAIDCETTTTWIDPKNSPEICRCRIEAESDQTPPTNPLKEFLKRMRAEIEAGRLETIFRVSGIGPPVSSERVTAVGLWLADCARRQEGLVGPRNIRHFLCPNLNDILECDCT
ncbi:PREDICTED: ropporin-1-like protein [Cyphomyrmex costatus]|uniref:ropporin-1-like protein n=1 Tax=Cyphomyrmex costatus TaxID=456900 RepID=UPI00085242E1|nr:PREDICTED: ropporin-1-like protein [Cyphomyrmex costatus]